MTQLKVIFGLIVFLLSAFLFIQSFKLYRRFKRASDNTTARNIYVVKCDNSVDEDFCLEDQITVEASVPRSEILQGQERRRCPRTQFQGFVDFINEGTLYKEQALDLSYSGIFIKSRTPEKYKENESIVVTFQTDEAGPQRRKGRIVRIGHTGIGVDFVA